jgi:hypothetical protein
MTSERRIGPLTTAALLAFALVFLASSCGQPTSSARLPTPSAAPGAPTGGPVPAQLRGDWFLPATDLVDVTGVPCPSPATAANCFVQLTFTATTYHQELTASASTLAGSGDVVVKNSEIDFFNGVLCGLTLPDGIGRYTWTLTGGFLHFTLISDPCPRSALYTHAAWSRTH